MIGCFNCLITAKCAIKICTVGSAPIKFEKIVMAMIKLKQHANYLYFPREKYKLSRGKYTHFGYFISF